MSDEPIRPFANGEEFQAFLAASCDRCVESIWDYEPYICDLQEAMDAALWGDGTISKDIAERLGYLERAFNVEGTPYFGWECKERKEAPNA